MALDLATRTGFAYGHISDEYPFSSSVQLAKPGSSHGAISAGLIRWLSPLLLELKPDIVVFEAPLPAFAKRGKRNANADRILSGLCFAVEGVAHCRGIHHVREASSSAVRQHFIGTHAATRVQAKKWTVQKCETLGWLATADEDAADACALWDYQRCLIDPVQGLRTTALFGRKATPQ